MRVLVGALLLLALTACAGNDPGLMPADPNVDVDTAELRQIKKEAGIELCPATTEGEADDGLPELSLPCLGGGPDVDIAGLRGPMVINFWASWCKPCRRELPYYQAFYEEYGDQVALIGIDWNDTQPREALELARDSEVTYPLIADPRDDLSQEGLRIPGLPGIAFIDADGKITQLVFEEIDSLEELEALVEEHLEVSL